MLIIYGTLNHNFSLGILFERNTDTEITQIEMNNQNRAEKSLALKLF